MTTQVDTFTKSYLKPGLLEVRAGDVVKVYQKVKEGDKERVQIFEGLVLAAKHGKGVEGTITIRKVAEGVGVERIFPIHSPLVEKIELVKRAKVRRAKLFYLRSAKGKRAKLKARELGVAVAEEPKEVQTETLPEKEEPVK
jgi:large subunit ribosomal protein L19